MNNLIQAVLEFEQLIHPEREYGPSIGETEKHLFHMFALAHKAREEMTEDVKVGLP